MLGRAGYEAVGDVAVESAVEGGGVAGEEGGRPAPKRPRRWRLDDFCSAFFLVPLLMLSAVAGVTVWRNNQPGAADWPFLGSPNPVCKLTLARIIVIRHCEKDGSVKHCSAVGYRRAAWIPSLFLGAGARWPVPARLYARALEQPHYVLRSVETLTPLAQQIGVDINATYGVQNVDKFAALLKHDVESGALCGKVVLICWKHENIPVLIKKLRYALPKHFKWQSNDYDKAVVIDYTLSRDGRDSKVGVSVI
mmetsp:Transcript_27508/g.94649  ORF Transcript_27508/g.94649 Transcript_27508/m.94649 type:complete len:251 (+) Transcript_27508:86-838(+)